MIRGVWGGYNRSSPIPRHDLIVLPLPDASERIILPQWIIPECIPRQYASQVRMAREDDAVHVIHLTLHPLRAGPDAGDAGDLQARVPLLDDLLITDRVPFAAGLCRMLGIEKDLEPEAI